VEQRVVTKPIQSHETSWTIIEGAANGSAEARERFAELYAPAVKAYLCKRWEGSPRIASVEDAVQDVFIACFKPGGVLDRVDRNRAGGFRAYFYGAARKTALHLERALDQYETHHTASDFDADRVKADEASLSEVFDRAWAQSIVHEAMFLYRERAAGLGGREMQRIEILRLRFDEGLPIREIATQLNLPPELAHKEYARARRDYRTVLEDVVASHYPGSEDNLDERCREVMLLLG
jgi:RNA polymerase sigma-70 factor (ECF subfamily)